MRDEATSAPAPAASPAAAAPRRDRRRLGELLVDAGVLTDDEVAAALAHTGGSRGDGRRERLGETITRLELASAEDIAAAVAEQLGVDYLAHAEPDPKLLAVAPHAATDDVLPLRVHTDERGDAVLDVACTDPTASPALDDAQLAVGYALGVSIRHRRVAVATRDTIVEARQRALQPTAADPVPGDGYDHADADAAAASPTAMAQSARILHEAIRRGATDVHIEPRGGAAAVRLRVDGHLRVTDPVPSGLATTLTSHLKVRAGMDVANRRVPQDGRFTHTAAGRTVEVRASAMPSRDGEKIVLRLLAARGATPLERTGLDAESIDVLRRAIASPQGLVLVTGPTGSGKTTTLYALVAELAGRGAAVATVEDPIEAPLDGVTQTAVDRGAGLDFAAALRGLLRQDPDVLLVGEIRDAETAQLAVRAALTGHLVLATLHANDAARAVSRLRDLGVSDDLIASTATLLASQRLLRRACPRCRDDDPAHPLAGDAQLVGGGDAHPTSARGCDACEQTGLSGRFAVAETIAVDHPVADLVASGAAATAVARTAQASGATTLRRAALAAAARGDTTLDEVARTTPDDDSLPTPCASCDAATPRDAASCPHCGARRRPAACRRCAHPVSPDWTWCAACGAAADTPDRRPAARHTTVADTLDGPAAVR